MSDGQEVSQGSFPGDASDGGEVPENVVQVTLTIGDHSGSHSERWGLNVGDVQLIAPFGEVNTETFPFMKGESYEITISHMGSTESPPDYDYTAQVAASGVGVLIDDPGGLLGVHNESDSNFAAGKSATLFTGVNWKIEVIDQDDPANEQFAKLGCSQCTVYGGSTPSTSDNLRVTIEGIEGADLIQWSISGQGSGEYEPPAGQTEMTWDIGDVAPGLGELTITVNAQMNGEPVGPFTRTLNLGVRTDDTIVIGWINPDSVALNPVSVNQYLVTLFPPTGPPVPEPTFAVSILDQLSERGDVTPLVNCLSCNPQALAKVVPLGPLNRRYLLRWLFKYGANADPLTIIPGGDFTGVSEHTDEAEVAGFTSMATNYKLFHRLQIKYALNGTTPVVDVLHRDSLIGTTTNPIPFLGITQFPGQDGPSNYINGLFGSGTAGSPYRYVSINDGSPDKGGVRIFHTLRGKVGNPALPLGNDEGEEFATLDGPADYWENIGTQIRFALQGETSPEIRAQPYPTYHIFTNGQLTDTITQAPMPELNFTLFPYPFGAVPCDHAPFGITPQGRCGDAVLPADSSARIPPSQYTVP